MTELERAAAALSRDKAAAALRDLEDARRPFRVKGVDTSRKLNSWKGRIDAQGFSRYTSKPEGGSSVPAPADEPGWEWVLWFRFGGVRARLNKFTGNLRRKLGVPRPVTLAEVVRALEK